MKTIILTFACFNGKEDKADKTYIRFEMYHNDDKAVYTIFTEAKYIALPDGELPKEQDLPLIADVNFRMRSYMKDGQQRYAPVVDTINSWKSLDIKKL